ncbi:transposase [Bradyrhizobium sp. 41S5]|nr:transposase [Bradyrhizobium sp. 41S5]UFX49306.1 transposase [Bradyrhizobium sp. 41S5]
MMLRALWIWQRTVAHIEATMLGLDIRFVVTSLDVGSGNWSVQASHPGL